MVIVIGMYRHRLWIKSSAWYEFRRKWTGDSYICYPSFFLVVILLANVSVIQRGDNHMEKLNRQVESRRDFRYGLYFRDVPNGLGDNFVSIMKQRKKDKEKENKQNYQVV